MSKRIGKYHKNEDYENEDWYFSKKEKDHKRKNKTKKSDYYGYDSYYGDEYQKPARKKEKYYY